VLRTVAVLIVASAALVLSTAGGSAALRPSGGGAAGDESTITLRLRYKLSPWKKTLYIKLVKTRLITFSLCAINDWQPGQKFDCDLSGPRLGEQTTLRLEQAPVGRALVRSDSPGWGMLGVSASSRLGAVLSNTVTGDRFGTFRYRVTLRDRSGQILASSNTVKVVWHR
jgi:hypothetical protein